MCSVGLVVLFNICVSFYGVITKQTTMNTEGNESSRCTSPRKSLKELIQEGRQSSKKEQIIIMEVPILEDPYKNTSDFKDVFRKQTLYGYVPSPRHHCPWDPSHPETPSRATLVHDVISDILYRVTSISDAHLVNIDEMDMLTLVHSHEHISKVREFCEDAEEEVAQQFDSIYCNSEDSYFSAVAAAKMTLSMAKNIAVGAFQNGFANVRPPGHHATPDVPNGYCFFNNIAIAAKYLLNENLAERILIVDYDVHHGQGTQRIFYDTNKVLYFSIHRYEDGRFWPNLEESSFDFIGEKNGKGYNVNVPLNQTGMTDFDYLSIIINVLLPIAYEFNPSIILISAGYDACLGCPEGRMNVTPAFYHHLITMLSGLAHGKILVVLEGGYFLPSLGEAALITLQALLNDSSPPLEYHKNINPSVMESINNVKVALRPYWKCFHQIDPIHPISDIIGYDRYNYHVCVKKYFGTIETPPFPTRGSYPENSSGEHAYYVAKLECLKKRYATRQTRVGYINNRESPHHNPPADRRAQELQKRVEDILKKFDEYKLIHHLKLVELRANLCQQGVTYPYIWFHVDKCIFEVHSNDYLGKMMRSAIEEKPDLYTTKHSKEVCHHSCAVLCEMIEELNSGWIAHGVAIIRPPGHHAKQDQGGGFCLINNVVVTAIYALKTPKIKRVLILDFDIHHGDGTQELTYDRNDIMYISMHRYDKGTFFPNDVKGNFTYVGQGHAAGYNLNIPFENTKMSNADYLYTWIKVVLPMSYTFNPDLILVSAGFDAGINDPLGRYNIHPEVFGHLIQLIKAVGPVILALEGGYNLETTSLGMVNCVRALLGHPLPMPSLRDVTKDASTTMFNSISVMKPFWPIMEVNKILDPNIRTQKDLDEAIAGAKKADITL